MSLRPHSDAAEGERVAAVEGSGGGGVEGRGREKNGGEGIGGWTKREESESDKVGTSVIH